MANTKKISFGVVKIPADYYEQVKQEAENRGCFVQRVVTDALDKYFDKSKRPDSVHAKN